MSVHVAMNDGILVTTFSGMITIEDLAALGRRVAEIEDGGNPAPNRLTDLTGAQGMSITFSDVLELARRRAERALVSPIRSAIIAANSAHRGFARMYQTLNDHPDTTIEIFEDRESALAWLRGDAERARSGADAVAPRASAREATQDEE